MSCGFTALAAAAPFHVAVVRILSEKGKILFFSKTRSKADVLKKTLICCRENHSSSYIHHSPFRRSTMAAQTSHPVLHYFDVAARGELSKLIAAVGGVEMTIKEYPFAVSM